MAKRGGERRGGSGTGTEGGVAPRHGAPPEPGEAGDSARGDGKARETRDNHQNDAANVPREDERQQEAPHGGVPTQGYTLPHDD
ncbi:MAG TPA: hypothetical protein VFP65_15435 [Anaeromyxobacteraceae bacterium]|nr:hypothetical protein [Anaeromyxobacteraceae bacterium]